MPGQFDEGGSGRSCEGVGNVRGGRCCPDNASTTSHIRCSKGTVKRGCGVP